MMKFNASVSPLIIGLLTLLSTAPPQPAQKAKPRRSPSVELVAEVEPQSVEENWKEFISKDGSFSVISPGELTYEQRAAETPQGSIQVHAFHYFANAEYSVSYADYLLLLENTDRQATFFDSVRDAGVKGINGRLLDEKEIKQNGHPGRSYLIEYGTDHGFLLAGRNIVVGQRLYMVTTSYRKHEVSVTGVKYEKWAERFLNSFAIKNQQNPAHY